MKPDCPYLHTVPKPKATSPRGKETFIAIYIPYLLGLYQ